MFGKSKNDSDSLGAIAGQARFRYKIKSTQSHGTGSSRGFLSVTRLTFILTARSQLADSVCGESKRSRAKASYLCLHFFRSETKVDNNQYHAAEKKENAGSVSERSGGCRPARGGGEWRVCYQRQ